MRRTTCQTCGSPIRLTKTGALKQHKLPPQRIIGLIEVTEEQRKKLEAEVRQWVSDARHIPIMPVPTVTYVGTPEFCPASGRYPKLVTA